MKTKGNVKGKTFAMRNRNKPFGSPYILKDPVIELIREGLPIDLKKPPQLFLSFATAQQELTNRFMKMMKPRLTDAGIPLPYMYNNAFSGARYGEEFRTKIAERIHTAPMAVVFVSAEYFASDICYRFELKLLLWRYRVQKMPIRVVYAARHPYEKAPIKFPIDGTGGFAEIVLSDLNDDRLAQPLPGFLDAPLQKLLDAREFDAVDFRLLSLADEIIAYLTANAA